MNTFEYLAAIVHQPLHCLDKHSDSRHSMRCQMNGIDYICAGCGSVSRMCPACARAQGEIITPDILKLWDQNYILPIYSTCVHYSGTANVTWFIQ